MKFKLCFFVALFLSIGLNVSASNRDRTQTFMYLFSNHSWQGNHFVAVSTLNSFGGHVNESAELTSLKGLCEVSKVGGEIQKFIKIEDLKAYFITCISIAEHAQKEFYDALEKNDNNAIRSAFVKYFNLHPMNYLSDIALKIISMQTPCNKGFKGERSLKVGDSQIRIQNIDYRNFMEVKRQDKEFFDYILKSSCDFLDFVSKVLGIDISGAKNKMIEDLSKDDQCKSVRPGFKLDALPNYE